MYRGKDFVECCWNNERLLYIVPNCTITCLAKCKNSLSKCSGVKDSVGGACLDVLPNPIPEFQSDKYLSLLAISLFLNLQCGCDII